MPYVDVRSKARLDEGGRGGDPITAGQLTYLIQQQLQRYLRSRGSDVRYEDLAVCLGALEGAKLDITNRIIIPYEEIKLRQNGDVWDENLIPRLPERPA